MKADWTVNGGLTVGSDHDIAHNDHVVISASGVKVNGTYDWSKTTPIDMTQTVVTVKHTVKATGKEKTYTLTDNGNTLTAARSSGSGSWTANEGHT